MSTPPAHSPAAPADGPAIEASTEISAGPALELAERTVEVDGHRLTLLHDGAEAFPAMLAAIADAKEEILLEMYWFEGDATGRRFAEALMRRAREGLRVAVLYDAVGSIGTSRGFWDGLRRAGVEVREFNPVSLWRRRFDLGALNRRNHRKLLVLDGRVGFTGGVNLADQWSADDEGGGGWRDDMVRVEGPACRTMRAIFAHGWETASGLFGDAGPLDERGWRHLPHEGEHITLLANHQFGKGRAIRRAYLRQIRRARRTVFLTNSYFLPDRVIRRALMGAARRGVDVRVLLPGAIDVPAVRYAGQRMLPRLLRAGVRVWEYGGAVLHAKTASVDGEWGTVGTYNLDHRSWRYNLEVNLAVNAPAFAAELEAKFLRDLGVSREVKPADLVARPLREKLLAMLFWRVRRLL